MSRIDVDSRRKTHVPAAQPAGSFYSGVQKDGRDEQGSLSGSEDGNYAQYPDVLKVEIDHEDDNTALTSQTLNADGTPKRPMNAFMIFARRRRPQVSAENQAMRTGEISKILSKEWTSMHPTDKQFYQDQARLLKDTFNAKYPDYVYRRRPNNSRRPRPRKPDTGARDADNTTSPDIVDDGGFDDVGESPIENEDAHVPDVIDTHRPRLPHDVQTFNDHNKFRPSSSRTSPYAYTMQEPPFRSNSGHESRSSYNPSTGDRLPRESPSTSSPQMSLPHQYQYMPQSHPQSHTQSHPQSHPSQMYSPEPVGSSDTWNIPTVRTSSWLGGADHPFTPHTAPKTRPPSTTSWNRQTSSTNSSLSPSQNQSNYGLPTLNSPFFPGQPPPEPLSTSSHSQPITLGTYNNMHTQLQGGEYNDHELSSSPSSSPNHTFPHNSGRDTQFYSRHGSYVPHSHRGLPPISNYSQSHPPPPPSSALSDQGYWPRE